MNRSSLATAMMWLGVAWLVAGCGERGRAVRAPKADTTRSDSAVPASTVPPEPGAPRTAQAVPVQGWTGPGGRPFDVAARTSERDMGHPRRYGSIELQTANRARSLGQYPCTSCHLGKRVVMADERIGDAHQNIQPVHPKQTGAHCSTCHAAEDVQRLALLNGERATLDESYRLCAECHFAQVDAWAHGAHGKRLDGWQGRRVVMACPDCHDPHQPAIQPRIPFRAPRIERTRSQDK
jgi:hypothetical protein